MKPIVLGYLPIYVFIFLISLVLLVKPSLCICFLWNLTTNKYIFPKKILLLPLLYNTTSFIVITIGIDILLFYDFPQKVLLLSFWFCCIINLSIIFVKTLNSQHLPRNKVPTKVGVVKCAELLKFLVAAKLLGVRNWLYTFLSNINFVLCLKFTLCFLMVVSFYDKQNI